MPHFSRRSNEILETCDSKLRILFESVIERYDCTIIEGFRNEMRQNDMVHRGLSKFGWAHSLHNQSPSRAVDVAPCPIDWQDTKRFYHFGGYVLGVAAELGTSIRWGGDWDSDNDLNDQTFMDLVHFELTGGMRE